MVTKLSIALVEVEKMGRIGKMAIKMGKVSTAGIPIGVRIAHRDHDAGHHAPGR